MKPRPLCSLCGERPVEIRAHSKGGEPSYRNRCRKCRASARAAHGFPPGREGEWKPGVPRCRHCGRKLKWCPFCGGSQDPRARALGRTPGGGPAAAAKGETSPARQQRRPQRGSRRPPSAAPPARIADRTIRKDGQFWKLVYAGEPVYLQDSMGIACLAQLVTNPGQDIPAIRLRSLVAGQDEELAVVSGGDVVDKLTVKDYRARLESLKERLENAERDNDLGTKRAVQEEIAAIEEQLVAAAGPGGCLRKVSDDAERARKSVSNAMRRTLKILEPKHPKLWRHFMSTLRLGAVCTYAPDGSVAWHS